MALMSMQELFYGESCEPASYFVHYARLPSPPAPRPVQFDLAVPMCCKKCEDEVHNALLALSSVTDVVCDAYNQRVTVTGYLDPPQALHQVKQVKRGATYWTPDCSQYQVSAYQKPSTNRSSPRTSTSSKRSGNYVCTACPGGYREPAVTHIVSVNATTETRVEMAY